MAGILRNRPLLLLAIGLIIGLSWHEYPWNALFTLPLLMLIGDWRRSTPLLLGLAAGIAFGPNIPKSGLEKSLFLESEAVVASVPRLYADRISYVVNVQGKKLTVSEPPRIDRSLGDRLLIRGVAKPISEGTEDWLLLKGVIGRISPYEVAELGHGPVWYRKASEVRKSFLAFSRRALNADHAAMLDALCFNVDGGLEAGFEDSLRRSGTIHIVSASGLHTLVLAWIIDAVLGILPIPRPYRLTILAVLLSFYAAAAGLQPAIVRSVVMSMIALSAYLWQREADLLSGLALSSVLYLAWDPLGIYNIGFQFSFLTVGAFAIFGKFEEERLKSAGQAIRSVALGTVKTTTIAYVATLPLLSFYFGAISLVSVFANIAIVPAAITLVAVGMGAFMIYGVLPGLSEIAANGIISPLLTYLEAGVTYFGNLSVASINWGMNSGYWVVAIYVLMLIWARERVRPS